MLIFACHVLCCFHQCPNVQGSEQHTVWYSRCQACLGLEFVLLPFEHSGPVFLCLCVLSFWYSLTANSASKKCRYRLFLEERQPNCIRLMESRN